MFYKTLHEAVEKQDVEDVMCHLNSPETNVNAMDVNQRAPLHIAAGLKSLEIVELLIDSGAEPSSKTLHCASEKKNPNMAIVKLLVSHGADILSLDDQSKKTPLDNAVINDNLPLVRFLISRKNSSYSVESLNRALTYACRSNGIEILRVLIEAGAQVIQKYHMGLHVAVERNEPELLDFFISLGLDVNARTDVDNFTALHKAIIDDGYHRMPRLRLGMVEKLLNAGADAGLQDKEGKTPLYHAIEKNNFEAVRLMLNKFKSNRFNVNAVSRNGQIPLVKAIEAVNVEIVRWLVDLGSDVNFAHPQYGTTPLLYVNLYDGEKALDIIKYLLKNGAKIDTANSRGSTVLRKLTLPSRRQGEEIYEKTSVFLLKYCDPNTVDSSGESNILSSCLKTDGYVWRFALAHLAKQQALGLPLHPVILNRIDNNPEFRRYFDKCARELFLAKTTKFKNSWITYFDLLVSNERMLKNYAVNPDLRENGHFENREFRQKFRIYGDRIRKNVSKGIERRELFDKSTIILYGSWPIFNITHLIIHDVLDNLTRSDLKTFCQ